MKATITSAYNCCRFIIPVLLTCGFNTRINAQGSTLSFPVNYRIVVKRPPAATPATEDSATSYTAMLKKGYAYIGKISSNSPVRNLSEKKFKSQLLKESGRMGASKAWVQTHGNYEYETIFTPGRTYYDYSGPGVHKVEYKDKYRNKKIKVFSGSADLFYYDPAFAAKQLNDAQKKWQTRMAAINEKRPLMIAKLEKINNKLQTYHTPSLDKKLDEFLINEITYLTINISSFKTGREKDGSGKTEVVTAASYSVKLYFQMLDDLIKETSPLFKKLSAGERSEMVLLVTDVKRFGNENWEVVCDFLTPTLTEQLLF